MRFRSSSLSALCVAALLGGCDSRPSGTVSESRQSGYPSDGPGDARRMPADSSKQRQADFLNRIRAADPQGKTIDRAVLNDRNELGLILDRSVQLDDIPKLMRSMLTQMAKEFPGEDLTVIAYTPSNPPRKIGTAKLDSRSRDMTYTPEA